MHTHANALDLLLRPEDRLQELVLSFYHVGVWNQVVNLDDLFFIIKHLKLCVCLSIHRQGDIDRYDYCVETLSHYGYRHVPPLPFDLLSL